MWLPSLESNLYVSVLTETNFIKSSHCLVSAATVPTGWVVEGQKENLCNRIKHILNDYGDDETVLIEFLQNADDASASGTFQ